MLTFAIRLPLGLGQGIVKLANEGGRAVDDERALLGRIANGDKNAFAIMYDRHVASVYGICYRILKNTAQAEDVTQSVFLTLWAKPKAFAGGNFVAWLSRVSRNAALDITRSAAVRRREPDMPEDVAAQSNLEDEVFRRVDATAIGQALQALPSDQREAIEQAYFGGLSYSEVAQRLGAPLGTIKSRIRAGLRGLWQTLQQQVRV
jgi:RNA polymerase sigma-70 factor, ECF subfamily